MSLSTNKEALLAGLSSFWTSLFKDSDTLVTAYSGQVDLMGEAYFDLMSCVLSRTLESAPLYQKKNWMPLRFSERDLRYVEGDGFPYKLSLPSEDQVVKFNLMVNKILDPSVVWERNVDFQVTATRVGRTSDWETEVSMLENPFTAGTDNDPIDDVPRIWTNQSQEPVKSGVTGSFINPGASIITFQDLNASFDILDKRFRLKLLNGPYAGAVLPIDSVTDATTIEVVNTHAINLHSNIAWEIVAYYAGWDLVFWAPDVWVDRKTLADSFGALVNRFEPSTEMYRQLLQGVFNYFGQGPDVQRLEAVLNVIVDIPVVREAEELLLDGYQTASHDVIVTDKHEYKLPLGKAKPELMDSENHNFGYMLHALQPLSTIFAVKDSITHPTWWHNVMIPLLMMPAEPPIRRQVTPDLFEVVYGNSVAGFRYGDIGLKYGADFNGNIPEDRPGLAHKHSYYVMEYFLKHHIFAIVIDSEDPLPRSEQDLEDIIRNGCPAHTFMWYAPKAALEDNIVFSDVVEIKAKFYATESMASDSALVYGTPGLKYGQKYFYEGLEEPIGSPSVTVLEYDDPEPPSGTMPIVYAGANPHAVPVSTPSPTGITDWPVWVKVRLEE